MSHKLRVYADWREEQSGIPRMLEEIGVYVIRENLSMGDYLLPGEVVVERKAAEDFISSLFDGRLFDQVGRMRDHYDDVILLIEGRPWGLYRAKGRERQIYGSLASLLLDYDVKLIYSEDQRTSASIIESLARRIVEEGRSGKIVIHKKPRLSTTREWQLYIASSFPGVGPKLAQRLLETFGSLEAIFSASVSELQKLLGEKRAQRMKQILRAPYERGEKKVRRLDEFGEG